MDNFTVDDNILPNDVFENIRLAVLPSYKEVNETSIENTKITWTYNPKINNVKDKDWKLFYMFHVPYHNTILCSSFSLFEPVLKYLEIRSLIRIKCNLYPNTETIKEHGMHTDYPFPHKSAILYINTCDGYTKFEDGTKIDSVANRMLVFEGETLHTSSSTTDQVVRCNINFNYV